MTRSAESTALTCPLCGGQAIALTAPHPRQSIVSDGRIVPFALKKMSCLRCGDASHVHALSPRDIQALYGDDYGLAAAAPRSDAMRAATYAQCIVGQVTAPGCVLEVGCGSGALLKQLREAWPQARFTGIDPALPIDEIGEDIRLSRCFIESMPHDVGQFDLVIAVNVIEHTSDPAAFLAALRARLLPQGEILIVFPLAMPANAELLFYDHLHSLTPQALNEAAARAGLAVRTPAFAVPNVGDFQMVVLQLTDELAMTSLQQSIDETLLIERRAYLDSWHRLDDNLAERSQTGRLLAFGGGQAAALLRAYAPSTWDRIEGLILDDPAEAWNLGKSVISYDAAKRDQQGSSVVIATAANVQHIIADRLHADAFKPILWSDVIAR